MTSFGGKSEHLPQYPRDGSRRHAEDFSRLVDYRDGFQPGARRFDMGEKSNPALLAGASAAIDMLLEWGVSRSPTLSRRRPRRSRRPPRQSAFRAAPAIVRAPHFLALSTKKPALDGLLDKLAAKNVFVSFRGTSIRVTPHLYNNDDDAWQLIDAVKRFVLPCRN